VKRMVAAALTALVLSVNLGAATAGPSVPVPPPPAALAGVPIYLALDLSSQQVLAARDAERAFLPASMTKAMSAYVAFELIAKGALKPDQVFTVRPETAALWQARGTGLRLKAGDRVSVDLLLHAITTVSANDAAVVLAEGAAGGVPQWLALMNAEAGKLGMAHSRFGTPNGWPDGGATRVSAGDMVKLGQALIARHPALYRRYFGQKALTWHGLTQVNHDPTLGVVPGADGIKTGHTGESGYSFLGTAERDGRRIMIVIGGARSEAERAAAARALLEWGFSAWEARPLWTRGAVVGAAAVQGGDRRKLGLVAPGGAFFSVPRGTKPGLALTIRYRGPLVAPIAQGAEVAQLELAVPGQPVARLPLVAAESVRRAGPIDRLANGLAGLLP
jgi:D-alanyl-D-alanine carboxypeptidase (penicillin-binding protein 5/6)